MKAQIKGIERTESGVFINVLPPNQVTDSKHAQLIKGLKTITGKYKKIPHDQNPFILAREFMDILTANDSEGTKSYILSENISKFPQGDFIRFGDRNWLKDVSRSWFSEAGTRLDVQVDIMNGVHGKEFTTSDIIDHVREHKPGEYIKPLQDEINSVTLEFSRLFDFKLTPAYARFLLGIEFNPKNKNLPF